MKKQVAFYGNKYRSAIIPLARYLNPDCEISFWIDDSESSDIRSFSGIPVISYKFLKDTNSGFDFDYIIVPEVRERRQVIDTLIQNDIPRDHILDWSISKNFLTENNILIFKNRSAKYEGLIFGMSHSYWGLYTSELSKKFFKFSMPAMDLYYINKQVQEILNDCYLGAPDKNCGFRSAVKYIIIELPYYMFNYDMSKVKNNIRNQMIIADYFEDYHNFDLNNNVNLINHEQFLLWKELFYDRMKHNASYCYFDHIQRTGAITYEQIEASKVKLSHVWTKTHHETINENIVIFDKLMRAIHNYDNDIEPIIVVMPQSRYEYINHTEIIESSRSQFEEYITDIMKKYDIKYHYYDFFKEYFDKDEYFYDLTHLNSTGAAVFSKMFDQRLKEEIY